MSGTSARGRCSGMDEREAGRQVLRVLDRSGLSVPETVAVVGSLLVSIIAASRAVGERLEIFDRIAVRLREGLVELDREQMQ